MSMTTVTQLHRSYKSPLEPQTLHILTCFPLAAPAEEVLYAL
jgi:hypothetical protein